MTPNERLLLLSLLAAVLASALVVLVLRMRVTPAEREHRRRTQLNRYGRMGDALVTDVSEDTVYFSYSVSGVDYTASQEVAAIRDRLPDDLAKLVGPVTVKYLARNPANSIVACEDWSGFHARGKTVERK